MYQHHKPCSQPRGPQQETGRCHFFQEHKLKGDAIAKLKGVLAKAGWNMQCGHCDDTTKKPNAGVGAAENVSSGLTIVQAERNTKAFQAAWSIGRAEKYEMDL